MNRLSVQDCAWIFDVFMDYGSAASHVRGRLINTEKNADILKEVPHREFLDLSLIYVVELKWDEQNAVSSIRISNDHMNYWGATEEELYRQVKRNMDEMDESSICSLTEMVMGMKGDIPEEILAAICSEYVPMYVLTNKNGVNGAVEMLNEELLRKFSAMFEKDLIVIPSSIHECMLVPASEEIADWDYIAQMVREINDTVVAEKEVLSYHVYKYERQTGTMTIAA